MRALIIANPQTVSDVILCLNMRYQGIEQTETDNPSDGVALIENVSPDFVILDSSVCNSKCGSIITKIRDFSDVPLLVLVTDDGATAKAQFLEAGADECIGKPVNCVECLSTINALLRRCMGIGFKPADVMNIDDRLTLDFNARELTCSSRHVHLTPIEFNLLSGLARNSGQFLTYKYLLEKIWGSNYIGDLDLLKKHVLNLRSKIEVDIHKPRVIVTERGFGYKLVKRT